MNCSHWSKRASFPFFPPFPLSRRPHLIGRLKKQRDFTPIVYARNRRVSRCLLGIRTRMSILNCQVNLATISREKARLKTLSGQRRRDQAELILQSISSLRYRLKNFRVPETTLDGSIAVLLIQAQELPVTSARVLVNAWREYINQVGQRDRAGYRLLGDRRITCARHDEGRAPQGARSDSIWAMLAGG